jgi:5-methylcytosine-specific restriction endonuclease McrA
LPKPICKRCSKAFKRKYGGHNANLYCSKKCFYDARNAGHHSWDRTNQIKANWHKCGPYSSAPSVMAMRHIAKCWKHIFKCKNLLPKMMSLAASQPKCEVCGSSCSDGAARFCSYGCNKEWRGDRQCRCGVIVHKCTAFGPPPACKECRRNTQREWRRISKSTRGRVRRGGGYWNPQVKAFAVFKRDNWTCYMCKAKCEKVYDPLNPLSATVDHVYPVAAGGDHDWHNVRTACASCNSRKGDRIKGQRLLRLK